jgi:hypothetical protein
MMMWMWISSIVILLGAQLNSEIEHGRIHSRLIGTIRRECVDHIVVLSEAHLLRTLREYAHYYNTARTHRSLDQDSPISRPVQQIGRIVSRAHVGELHHQYVRI